MYGHRRWHHALRRTSGCCAFHSQRPSPPRQAVSQSPRTFSVRVDRVAFSPRRGLPARVAYSRVTRVCAAAESHILMRSPYFKNGYQTVHGKNVKLGRDGVITTVVRHSLKLMPPMLTQCLQVAPGLDGAGFSEQRTVKVLHDETVYDEGTLTLGAFAVCKCCGHE